MAQIPLSCLLVSSLYLSMVPASLALLDAPSEFDDAIADTSSGDTLADQVAPGVDFPVSEDPEVAARAAATQHDPLLRVLQRLAENPDGGIEALGSAVRELFQPPADSTTDEVGDLLKLTYPIGDVTGDTIDDFAFDLYCVDAEGCEIPPIVLEQNPCATTHLVRAIDGATGNDTIWRRLLDQPWKLSTPLLDVPAGPLACVLDFVIGTFPPNEAGIRDLLLYRWEAKVGGDGRRQVYVIHHDLMRLDAQTGKVLWHYAAKDGLLVMSLGQMVARNFVAIPMLQTPPTKGLRLLPENTQASLHVRGVGFTQVAFCVSCESTYVRSYQPEEWAARLDPTDGKVLWDKETFQPDHTKSVMPFSYESRHFAWGPYVSWVGHMGGYFSEHPCCFDLTGDGVPDLVYGTWEWAPYRVLGQLPFPGPEGFAARFVVFDGATGDRLWEKYVEPDSGPLRFGTPILLPPSLPGAVVVGDVNGDHASDIGIVLTYLTIDPTPRFTLQWFTSVYSGKDGAKLWDVTTKRQDSSFVNPLGDADGDGGNDLLTVKFHGFVIEPPQGINLSALDQHIDVQNGKQGGLLWHVGDFSFAMGADTAVGFGNLFANGLPDYDGDRVGDFYLDRIEQLPDLTVVHHTRFVSGRNGSNVTGELQTVGAFLVPLRTNDLDGDGQEDILLLQGDMPDLWVTAYRAADVSPLWSRRVLAIADSSSISAFPIIRLENLELDAQPGQDLFFNFVMVVSHAQSTSVMQRLLSLHGASGHQFWSQPEADDEGDDSLLIGRATPATEQYLGVPAPETAASSGFLSGMRGVMILSAGSVLGIGSVVGTYLLTRRRWAP